MNRNLSKTIASLPLFLGLFLLVSTAARAQWTAPTPEELKMTAQAEVPGAAAVYLFREEITEDKLHMWSKYVRLKVLTERGKDFATVELEQYHESGGGGYTVNEIQGRTIHADGTIVPFTATPFEKLIQKGQGYAAKAKVFTLPDVQIGSIVEYRYKLRYDDDVVFPPTWYVQSELYTRKGHYLWKPTDQDVVTKNERGERVSSSVTWTPILPNGTEVKQTRTASYDGPGLIELNVHDIPPAPDEEYMPPVESLSYRVLFYYTSYHSSDEYWKSEGKVWAKNRDKFIGPGPKVNAAVQQVVAGGDTQDQKLRKLYAEVMKIDNTAFDRQRSAEEQKAQGLAPPKTTDDIWERKRGSDDQIAQLFVAMARAAGMKAYIMSITNRDHRLFLAQYLSFGQLDDYIAIVNVDGKEQFFDPGQRFCPYGHLQWKHTRVEGLRQVEGGSALSHTPGEPYNASKTQRLADLTLDENGEVTGNVTMAWTGAQALAWRQRSLRGDDTSLRHDLQTEVERLLPGGTEVKVKTIDSLDDYEKMLKVTFDIKGPVASSTGKRLLIPADIFTMNSKPSFPHDKRDMAIYFEYPYVLLDVVRVQFPATLAVESKPVEEKVPYQKSAFYSFAAETAPTSFTIRREFDLGTVIIPQSEYADLRTFYNKLEAKDQEPVVLKTAAQGN